MSDPVSDAMSDARRSSGGSHLRRVVGLLGHLGGLGGQSLPPGPASVGPTRATTGLLLPALGVRGLAVEGGRVARGRVLVVGQGVASLVEGRGVAVEGGRVVGDVVLGGVGKHRLLGLNRLGAQ